METVKDRVLGLHSRARQLRGSGREEAAGREEKSGELVS